LSIAAVWLLASQTQFIVLTVGLAKYQLQSVEFNELNIGYLKVCKCVQETKIL
jgi:hypothetical protein